MLLLLDLDGTLVDSFADIRFGLARAFEALGREAPEEILALATAGMELEAYYRAATGREDAAELARFIDAYRSCYFDNPDWGRAYPGVRETLAALRARHPELAVAVATTKRTRMAARVVERAGLADLIDHVQGSDDLPVKPDPTILRLSAERLARPLAGAVMVGDTDRDIGAARAAGCVAVGVTYGGWGARMAELDPDHVIDRFGDLERILSV